MSSPNVITNTSTSLNVKNEYLTGVIERITFHAEDTGYTVARMQVKGFKDLVTIIRNLGLKPRPLAERRTAF